MLNKEEKEIQRQLKTLQQVKAPKHLHAYIRNQTAQLPDMHTGFYFSLIAFRTGIAVAAFLIFVLATSSIVVAAVHSTSGAPLYPVKVLIQKVAPGVIQQKDVKGVIAPTPTHKPVLPTPTIQEKKQDNKGSQGESIIYPQIQEKNNSKREDEDKSGHKNDGMKNFQEAVKNTVRNLFNQHH